MKEHRLAEHLLSAEEVIEDLETNPERGLSDAEAARRLGEFGQNKLAEAEKDPLWKRFFSQMADPMIIMLIIAAAISAVVGVADGSGDFADVIIILFVVIVNAVLGVVQESKAEEALAALQEMAAATSKVIRGGKMEVVHSSDLVPGDIVLLEAGDSVPADCRVLESASMRIEEASLTGESVPVEKHTRVLEKPEDADDVPLGDRKNMCYMGSTVVYGRGRAVVTSTGMKTEMGKIADALTLAENEQTPLQIKLAELSKILTVGVVVICAIIFLTGFIKNGSAFLSDISLVLNTFMIAVSLAVAAIPEGLVAVVTIVLSIGVTKMSKQNAIIRKLTAVETLGCTQLICSDKTGTLTQNRMTVVRHETENLEKLVKGMALCSDAKWDVAAGKAIGEPTEAALVADAAKLGYTSADLDSSHPRIGEAPFDSGRKMMSTVTRTSSGRVIQYTKGGPDVVLSRCTHMLTEDGSTTELTDELREKIMGKNKAMADDALRVLASARRDWNGVEPESYDADYLERDLTFVGLSAMIDPVRPEVRDAVDEAHSAGIRVVMITGDHVDTAVAIARELGIIEGRDQAMTGSELDRLSDEELDERIEKIGVYARVQPEHKTRIVDTWRKRGKVTAMTGDGVNDAPSIKRADIGVGMGITGTDVTKNVADMVLADDNFATIVAAVEEGRRIYDNIRKAIQFLLSSNLAEVISVFVASLVGFTILEPTHLLWINLITDCFPALAMGMEDAEPGIVERPPRDSKDGIFSGGLGIDCLFQGIVIAVLTIASYFIGLHVEGVPLSDVVSGASAGRDGMTMAFLTLSMVEMFHSFNMRSRRKSIVQLKTQNKWLWLSFAGSLILTYLVIETRTLSSAFGFSEISIYEYGIAMALAISIIPIVVIYKAIMRAVEKGK